jgi:hypothetical protein
MHRLWMQVSLMTVRIWSPGWAVWLQQCQRPATRVFAPRFWDVISSSYMPNISFQYRPSHTAGLNGRVESYLVPLSSRPLSHE